MQEQASLPVTGAPIPGAAVAEAVVSPRAGHYRWVICALLFCAATTLRRPADHRHPQADHGDS